MSRPCICGFQTNLITLDKELDLHEIESLNYPTRHRPVEDIEWSGEKKETYNYIDNMEDLREVVDYLTSIHAELDNYRLAIDLETYSIDPDLPSDEPSRPIRLPL